MYDAFAPFYDAVGMTRFSDSRAQLINELLGKEGVTAACLLDMACGTGTFCQMMAQDTMRVTGIDLSAGMIAAAKQKQIAGATFLVSDISDFELNDRFDVVTCNHDSLNHLLTERQVQAAFECAYRHMNVGGLFCFDVNTIAGLRRWRYQDLQHGDSTLMLRHGTFDESTRRGMLFIDGFVQREDGLYTRFQETVIEMGYPLTALLNCLETAGFREVKPVGRSAGRSMVEMENDPRAIICARR